MGTHRAANDRSCRKNKTKRRNRTNLCKVTNQSSDRVHQNEQRRNSGRLSNVGPPTEKQERCQKYSAAGPCQPRKKSKTGSYADGRRSRRSDYFRWVSAAKDQTHRREKKHQPNQNFQDGSGRLQIPAKIGGWN